MHRRLRWSHRVAQAGQCAAFVHAGDGSGGGDVDVLALVERVHPTPAIGGYPRAEALALIRETENLDRGWYAGPVGWMDGAGDGEFAVGLRSAL